MDLAESIIYLVDERLKTFKTTLNTAIVGNIVSFNPVTVTAEIQIGVSFPLDDGTPFNITNLLNVPIMVLQAGGFSMTFPIKAGDECIVFFSQRDISLWLENGGQIQTSSKRQLNMSDAVALVGLQSAKKRVVNYDPDNLQIRTENASLTITPDGEVLVDTRSEINITSDNGINITGNVDIDGEITVSGNMNTDGKLTVATTIDDGNGCLSTHIHHVDDTTNLTDPPTASAPCV